MQRVFAGGFQNTPEDAAATVYRKRMELAAAYHRSVVAERAKSFLEFLVPTANIPIEISRVSHAHAFGLM
ncbi:MAG: hypothetical protein ACO3GX_13375 [Gemmataceae bacterium]